MEDYNKGNIENESVDGNKLSAKNENAVPHDKNDVTGNGSFEQTPRTYKENETTGSGFSVAERAKQDGTNTEIPRSTEELVSKYNIDDQAHRDSSKSDFIETVSNFHHSDSDKSSDDANRDFLAD